MMRVMVLSFLLLHMVHGLTSPYPNEQDSLVCDEISGSHLHTYIYIVAWQKYLMGKFLYYY